MRLKIGENFSLFNQSGEWEVSLDSISKGIVNFTTKKLKRSKNNFQIAELGIKKYDKIAESCMDDEMRLILNLKDDLV